jgi:hypothetical protein
VLPIWNGEYSSSSFTLVMSTGHRQGATQSFARTAGSAMKTPYWEQWDRDTLRCKTQMHFDFSIPS